MKKKSNLYIILTYLFFIYPPFIWGFVLIFKDGYTTNDHTVSLLINAVLIVLIVGACALKIVGKELHIPDKTEIRYLAFGFIGNVVVYFYTFQNLMKIQNIVTIYAVLLIVLGVHYLLISKKITAKELWILLPIYFVIDFLHLAITGCGFTNANISCYQTINDQPIIYILYIILVLVTLGYYIYRIYLLKQNDIFKYGNIALIVLLSVMLQGDFSALVEIKLTLGILLPLLTIIDFVVSIVNKKYNPRMLFFYIRTYFILAVFVSLGAMNFFSGEAGYQTLAIMVGATYVSLFITIVSSILKISDTPSMKINKDIKTYICAEHHINQIKESFGELEAKHVTLADDNYSIVSVKDDEVIGFISSSIKPLTPPLEDVFEGYLDIIEVKEEYRRTGIATKMIKQTENYYRSLGLSQIRGWSNQDKVEAINLWNKLEYSLSPSLIHLSSSKENINGYYFIKKL